MNNHAIFNIRKTRFMSGERFTLLIERSSGVPDHEVTVYVLTEIRVKDLSASTINTVTRSIRFGLQILNLINIDLDFRLDQGKIFELWEIDSIISKFNLMQHDINESLEPISEVSKKNKILNLESVRMIHEFRKKNKKKVSASTAAIRIIYFRNFLKWKVNGRLLSMAKEDARYDGLSRRFEIFIDMLNNRIPDLSPKEQLNAPIGLTKSDLDEVRKVIKPDAENNPWESYPIRIRNYLVVETLLNLGIRKGELLGIKVKDINFRENTIIIHRRADDPEEFRLDEPKAKTDARSLAMSEELSRHLYQYVIKYRKLGRLSNRHTFLFATMGSGQGNPLSISSVNKIFVSIKKSLPQLTEKLSAHIMRHTWNDEFSEQADKKHLKAKDEENSRSALMGWKQGSKTSAVYRKRSIRKKANDASLEMQNNLMSRNGKV